MTPRIAVVTGGLGGLGSAICARLAIDHTVIAVDIAIREDAVQRIHRQHPRAELHALACDVTDFDACADLIAGIQTRFGRIDVLVNAAGITRDATLRKMTREHWDAVLAVDLDSVFNLCRQVVDGMCTRRFGRIVNISSVNGQTGQFGQTNYAAAKAGMHGFTMALAREVARHGVTVNSVAPGYIDTEMTRAVRADIRAKLVEQIPVGRIGHPEDIARVVAFLCAEDAGYLTGALIPVNGGMFMSF